MEWNLVNIKGALTIFGAILNNLVCGSLYSWPGLNLYYISYLRNHGSPTATKEDGYFFMPLITFTAMCTAPIATLIANKVGVKATTLFSLILAFLANLNLYFSSNIKMIYGSMICYGIINSLNFLPVLKNALLYFPNKKGLINGMVTFGFGTSSLIFNSLADYIINPNYKKINPSTHYFDDDVSNNVITYIKLFNFINDFIFIIGFFLTFEYKNDLEGQTEEKKLGDEKNKTSKDNERNEPVIKDALRQAYKGIQFYQLLIMSTVVTVFSFTITNTYRTYGQQRLIDEKYLSYLTKVRSILNGVSRFIWGALFDKFKFKILYGICISFQIFVGFILPFSVNYPSLFFITLCLQSIIISGKLSLTVSIFTRIYGINNFSIVYSFASVIGGCCNMLAPLLIKLIFDDIKEYNKLYYGWSILCFFCLVILLFFSEKKFEFKTQNELSGEEGIELQEKMNE